MNRINYVKEIMEERRVDYWTASSCFDAVYFDSVDSYQENLFKVFSGTVEDIDKDLYLHIVATICGKNKNVILEEEYETKCVCPECGDTLWEDSGSYMSWAINLDVFEKLTNAPKDTFVRIDKGYDVIRKKHIYTVEILEPTVYEEGEVCEACENRRMGIRKLFYDCGNNYKEGGTDKIFDCKVWSHGLASGYSGNMSASDLLGRFSDLNPSWQICCSDKKQRIGGIGIYAQGHVQYVSNIDLRSYVDENGNRIFDPTHWRAQEGLITSIEDYSLDEWDHTEIILTNFKIVGIWIKDWFFNQKGIPELLDALCKIAIENSMAIHVVKARKEK